MIDGVLYLSFAKESRQNPLRDWLKKISVIIFFVGLFTRVDETLLFKNFVLVIKTTSQNKAREG